MKNKFKLCLLALVIAFLPLTSLAGCDKGTINYYDASNTIVYSVKVGSKDTEFKGTLPTKDADLEYTYSFENWIDEDGHYVNPAIVSHSVNLYPKFKATKIEYHLQKANDVVVTKGESSLADGDAIFYGDRLIVSCLDKTRDIYVNGTRVENNFTFNISGNTAVETTTHRFTIRFYDEDKQTLLEQLRLTRNQSFTAPTPTKSSTVPGISYEFEKWVDAEGNLVVVNALEEDTSVFAYYKTNLQAFSLSISDDVVVEKGDYILNSESILFYGDTLTISCADQTKDIYVNGTKVENGYTFDVTNNVVITTAVYTFTISYYDDDQTTLLDQDTLTRGQTASAPNPTKVSSDLAYTYEFDKWVDENGNTVVLNTITEDTSVYASFKQQPVMFTVLISGEDLIVTHNGTPLTNNAQISYNSELVATVNNLDKQLLVNGEKVTLDSTNSYTIIATSNISFATEQRLYELPYGKYDIVGYSDPESSTYNDLTYTDSFVVLDDGWFFPWNGVDPNPNILFAGEMTYTREVNKITGLIHSDTLEDVYDEDGNQVFDENGDPVQEYPVVDTMNADIVGDGVIVYDGCIFVYNPYSDDINFDNADNNFVYFVIETFFNNLQNANESTGVLRGLQMICEKDESGDSDYSQTSYFVSAEAFELAKESYNDGSGNYVDENGDPITDYQILEKEATTLKPMRIALIAGKGDILGILLQTEDGLYVLWGKVFTQEKTVYDYDDDGNVTSSLGYSQYVYQYNCMIMAGGDPETTYGYVFKTIWID